MLKKFYHYTKYIGAKEIISNRTIKCSSPYILNDPFDTKYKIDIDYDIDELKAYFVEKYNLNKSQGNKELISNKESKETIGKYIDEILENQSEEWLNFIKKFRIFCLSEINDDLLMWAHYANRHKGAVIEFKCIPNNDCPFCEAKKMRYKENKPNIGNVKKLLNYDYDAKEIKKKYILTKSKDWEYEKEWRLILKRQNINKKYDIRPISHKYINGIYLGLKMEDEKKQNLIEIAKEFQDLNIYETKLKDSKKFDLEFNQIVVDNY